MLLRAKNWEFLALINFVDGLKVLQGPVLSNFTTSKIAGGSKTYAFVCTYTYKAIVLC